MADRIDLAGRCAGGPPAAHRLGRTKPSSPSMGSGPCRNGGRGVRHRDPVFPAFRNCGQLPCPAATVASAALGSACLSGLTAAAPPRRPADVPARRSTAADRSALPTGASWPSVESCRFRTPPRSGFRSFLRRCHTTSLAERARQHRPAVLDRRCRMRRTGFARDRSDASTIAPRFGVRSRAAKLHEAPHFKNQ